MGKKKRKKRFRRLFRRALIGAGGGVLTVLIFLAVFRTKQIEVTGNNRYTEEEIQKLVEQEPFSFNTVLLTFLPWRQDFSQVPFLDTISYEFISVSSVRAVVSEKRAVGYLETEGQKAYFDGKGIVLECVPDKTEESDVSDSDASSGDNGSEVSDGGNDETQTEILDSETLPSAQASAEEYRPNLDDIPLVTGLGESSVKVGEQITVKDTGIFERLDALARLLDSFDIWPYQVEISEEQDMTLYYEGPVRALLGGGEYMEEKITKLSKILPKLDGLSGELQLQDVNEQTSDVVFVKDIPSEADGETAENQTEENGAEDTQSQADAQ